MRIAVDMRSVAETGGRISGVENYFINIFNRLTLDGGDEIIPVINRYKSVRFPKELKYCSNLKQTNIPNKIFNALLYISGYPKFESIYGDFDLLWMPDIRPFSISKKTKLAITVHDISSIVSPEYYSVQRRIWHKIADYGRAIKRADIIFAVSEYTKEEIITKYKINPDKIQVVYPAVDRNIFHPLKEDDKEKFADVKKRYGLPGKYILTLSTIEPRKNIQTLIEAFEQIQSETYLVIGGKLGWLYKDILKRIENSPKRKFIKMLGYVSEKDKPLIMAGAEILCYPSFYEGFGFQPLEAMSSGVPVIASTRTSVPEVCGGAALLVEPYHSKDIAKAIELLLSDEGLRKRLIEKGLQRSMDFNWQDSAAKIYSSFRNLK